MSNSRQLSLYGGGVQTDGAGPMGALASGTMFGHNGSYVCIGWADLERRIAIGYVTVAAHVPHRLRPAHGHGQRRHSGRERLTGLAAPRR